MCALSNIAGTVFASGISHGTLRAGRARTQHTDLTFTRGCSYRFHPGRYSLLT